MKSAAYPRRQRYLFDAQGVALVDGKTYALERSYDRLSAALDHDARRHWWQRPDRLWVGRIDSALRLIQLALEAEPDA